MMLKVGRSTVDVKFDDIMYVEALDNYVKVIRRGQPLVISLITLKEVEKMLPADRFSRSHRSYIMGIDHIEKIQKRRIHLKGLEKTFAIGRKYYESFMDFYKSHRHQGS